MVGSCPSQVLELTKTLTNKVISVHENFVEQFSRTCEQWTTSTKKNTNAFIHYCVEKVSDLVRSVLDVCYIQLGRLPSMAQLLIFCQRYFLYSLIDQLEDAYKFHSAFQFSRMLHQEELPPKPNLFPQEVDGFIIGGWVERFLRRGRKHFELSNRDNEKDQIYIGFSYSLMDCKRGCPAVSPMKQAKALDDHQKAMTGSAYLGTSLPDEPSPILKEIMKCSREIFKECVGPFRPRHWVPPSVSAHFDGSRKQGGAHYSLKEILYYGYELIGMIAYRTKLSFVYGHYVCNKDSLIELYNKWHENRNFLIDPRINANVHIVLEPFKVRTITCGESIPYQIGRLVNREIHSRLRQWECFRLIGEKCDEQIINDHFQGTSATYLLGQKFEQFLSSIDYKNATDGLHPLLVKTLANTICKYLKVPSSLEDVFYSSVHATLGNHTLHYNVNGKQKIVEQTHGQLMGSPISFVLLCIFNAAVLLAAWREYIRRLTRSSWDFYEHANDYLSSFEGMNTFLRPLFNGDDGLYSSNKDLHEIWKVYATEAGLTPSVGKSYITGDLAMINSEMYYRNSGVFQRVYTTNSGLIKGRSKVISDSRDERLDGSIEKKIAPICDQLEELRKHCKSSSVDKRVQEVFFSHSRDLLMSSNRSWVLPRALGGLGLPFGTATYHQRKLAGYLLKSYDKSCGFGMNKPGYLEAHDAEVKRLQRDLQVTLVPPKFQRKREINQDTEYSNYCRSQCNLDFRFYFDRRETKFELPQLSNHFLTLFDQETSSPEDRFWKCVKIAMKDPCPPIGLKNQFTDYELVKSYSSFPFRFM